LYARDPHQGRIPQIEEIPNKEEYFLDVDLGGFPQGRRHEANFILIHLYPREGEVDPYI
jgi:hypothetical protein